jgi:hypothetical protein
MTVSTFHDILLLNIRNIIITYDISEFNYYIIKSITYIYIYEK